MSCLLEPLLSQRQVLPQRLAKKVDNSKRILRIRVAGFRSKSQIVSALVDLCHRTSRIGCSVAGGKFIFLASNGQYTLWFHSNLSRGTNRRIEVDCRIFKVTSGERNTLTPRPHIACSMLAIAGLLVGCSLRHPIGLTRSQKVLAFQVNVSADANQNSVVPFDVVVVRDKDLLKQVEKMDAAAWFGPKGRCQYRGGPKAKIQFYSWEFVPNQMYAIDVPAMDGAKAVLGFARYASPGEHRVTLATKGGAQVDIGESGVHASTIAMAPNRQAAAPASQKVCPDD